MCVWTKIKTARELVRNTTSAHISFGCCSDLCLMFLVHLGSFRFFIFCSWFLFFFTWYCISLVFYIILLWFNSSVLKIFLLNFSRSTCNNNVTQPQSFLIGIRFSVYAIWNGVTPMKMSFLLSFHFQVILVDLLVQVQNVKKFLIYYFRRDFRFMKHKYSAGTLCIVYTVYTSWTIQHTDFSSDLSYDDLMLCGGLLNLIFDALVSLKLNLKLNINLLFEAHAKNDNWNHVNYLNPNVLFKLKLHSKRSQNIAVKISHLTIAVF